MADNVETLVVAVQVDGEEKLADLAAKADQVTAATNRARDARGRFVGGSGGGGGGSSSPEEQIAAGMSRAAKSADDLAEATEKGGSKVAGFGQAALQSGRIVQDFAQGGIGGILNNIEGLTMALGLGSGLAGVLTIVGVGFLTLKPQIMAFWEALSGGDSKQILSQFETLSTRIKELKEQPLKLAVDRLELDEAEKQLDRLKRGHAEFEAQQRRQTVAESDSGKAIDDVLGEAGAPGLEDAMKARLIRTTEAQSGPLAEARRKQAEADAEIRAARDAAKDATTPEDLIGASGALKLAQQKRDAATEEARQIKGAIETNAEGSIGGIIEGAKKGHGADLAARQGQLADQLRGIGRDDLARQVERNNPQRFRDIEALNAQGAQNEAAGKIAADAEKARDEAAKEKKKADGAPMDDAVRAFKGEQEEARARRKADGAPMDDAVRIFKGEQEAKKGAKKAADARQKEAMARAIFNEAGGRLTPDQSRDAAGDAQKSMQQMGQFGRTQMGANQAMYAAMNHQLAAMRQMMVRIEQQAAGFDQLGRGFNQVFGQANQRQATALNFGGK